LNNYDIYGQVSFGCHGRQRVNKLNNARRILFSNSYPHGYFNVDIKQPQQLHVDLGLFVFHKLLFYVH